MTTPPPATTMGTDDLDLTVPREAIPAPSKTALRRAAGGGRRAAGALRHRGARPEWADCGAARRPRAGADAMRSVRPFSDPVMDGPVIQAASRTGPGGGGTRRAQAILDELAEPRRRRAAAVMTYYNIVFRTGPQRFARR